MNSTFVARIASARRERAQLLHSGLEIEALISGSVLNSGEPPVAGDYADARMIEPGLALVERVHPRRTKLSRRNAGRRGEEQVLAANADIALLVTGLDHDFNPRRIDRYLALVREGGVQPVVVLNKADLHADPSLFAAQIHAPMVFSISARTGHGVAEIEALLIPGTTAVLLGSSGAGKSTLLNRLLGDERHATAPVRAHDSRGRHTTTHRELLPLPNGAWIIDTPGLREIQLHVRPETIDEVFADIAEMAQNCRFRDCQHQGEPGCAVLDSTDPARLESYRKLKRELAWRENPLSAKQRWRAIHKAAKRLYKERGR